MAVDDPRMWWHELATTGRMHRRNRPIDQWVGIGAAAVFAAFGVGAVVQGRAVLGSGIVAVAVVAAVFLTTRLVTGRPHLTVDATGVRVEARHVPWHQVRAARVGVFRGSRFVVLDLGPGAGRTSWRLPVVSGVQADAFVAWLAEVQAWALGPPPGSPR